MLPNASAGSPKYRAALVDLDDTIFDHQWYQAAYGREWRTVPGARELIERLRALGVVVAVITNGKSVEQAEKLRVLGLHDAVDAVFVSEAVGSEKPARAFFEHVTSRLSIPCAQCVVVGDLWETDIQGALNSGIDAIWLNRYGRTCPPTPGVCEITSLEPTEQVLRLLLA